MIPTPPLYSTITLFTEIGITCFIFYVFYSGYKKNRFPHKLAFVTLAYEILFNISYMAGRVLTHKEVPKKPDPDVWLAALHGILSLIMFIALVIFLILAWKNYEKGINYFKKHKVWTFVFLFFWLCAVISGILFYIFEYHITG